MNYIKPSMEFILFDEEDIVCASPGSSLTPGTPDDGWDDREDFDETFGGL